VRGRGRTCSEQPFLQEQIRCCIGKQSSQEEQNKKADNTAWGTFYSRILHSCPTIANADFQPRSHGGMHSKRLEAQPDAFSEYDVGIPGIHAVHLAKRSRI